MFFSELAASLLDDLTKQLNNNFVFSSCSLSRSLFGDFISSNTSVSCQKTFVGQFDHFSHERPLKHLLLIYYWCFAESVICLFAVWRTQRTDAAWLPAGLYFRSSQLRNLYLHKKYRAYTGLDKFTTSMKTFRCHVENTLKKSLKTSVYRKTLIKFIQSVTHL